MFEHAWLLMGAAFLGVLAVYGLSRLLEARTASFRARHRIWTHAVAAQFVLAALLFAIGPAGWPAQLFTRSAAQSHSTGPIDLPTPPFDKTVARDSGPAAPAEKLQVASVPERSRERDLTADALPRQVVSSGNRSVVETIRMPNPTSVVSLLIGVWFGGTLLLVARLVLQEVRWWYTVRQYAAGAPPSVVVCVERLVSSASCRWRPRVIVGPLMVPAVTGIFRPLLVWPASAADLAHQDPRVAQAVLAHELAHIRHRDPLWKLLAHLLSALLWWHPGVWWTRKRLQEVSEFAADEAAMAWGQDRVSLANGLLRFATDALGLASLAASGEPVQGLLRRRVQHVLKGEVGPERTKRRQQLLVWTTAFATWLGGSGVAHMFPSGGGGSVMSLGLRFWRQAIAAVAIGVAAGWSGLHVSGAPQEEEKQADSSARDEAPAAESDRRTEPGRADERKATGESPRQIEALRWQLKRLEELLLQAQKSDHEEDIARITRQLRAVERQLAIVSLKQELAIYQRQLRRLERALETAENEADLLRLQIGIDSVRNRIRQAAVGLRTLRGPSPGEVSFRLREGIDKLIERLIQTRALGDEREIAELEREIEELETYLYREALRLQLARGVIDPRNPALRDMTTGELVQLLDRYYRGKAQPHSSKESSSHPTRSDGLANRVKRAVEILRLAGLEEVAELLESRGQKELMGGGASDDR